MSDRYRRNMFDHPSSMGRRKSVVREGRPAGRTGAQSGRTVGTAAGGSDSGDNQGGVWGLVSRYRTHLIIGAGVLTVGLVYYFYKQRMSAQKDPAQVEAGLRALSSGGHAGALGASRDASGNTLPSSGRAPLQVDPAVIEALQQQVFEYQSQVDDLENALNQRELQLAQIQAAASQQMQQQPPPMQQHQMELPPYHASGPGQGGANQFTGLHGQVPPPMAMGGMGGGPGGMAGGSRGDPPPPSGGPVSMGAFSDAPGLGSSMSGEIQLQQGGFGGAGGSNQFTPL